MSKVIVNLHKGGYKTNDGMFSGTNHEGKVGVDAAGVADSVEWIVKEPGYFGIVIFDNNNPLNTRGISVNYKAPSPHAITSNIVFVPVQTGSPKDLESTLISDMNNASSGDESEFMFCFILIKEDMTNMIIHCCGDEPKILKIRSACAEKGKGEGEIEFNQVDVGFERQEAAGPAQAGVEPDGSLGVVEGIIESFQGQGIVFDPKPTVARFRIPAARKPRIIVRRA